MDAIDSCGRDNWVHIRSLCSALYKYIKLAPGKFEWNFRHVILKQILVYDGSGIFCEIALIWMLLDFTYDEVNIGSGNGLVPSGNKPLPEPMLN